MKKKEKMEKLNYVACKVGKKPIKIYFYTKDGRRVTFKGYRTFIKNKLGASNN